MNKKILIPCLIVLSFFASILMAHISASVASSGLSFFYMLWCAAFGIASAALAVNTFVEGDKRGKR
jgi:hypothetical protein